MKSINHSRHRFKKWENAIVLGYKKIIRMVCFGLLIVFLSTSFLFGCDTKRLSLNSNANDVAKSRTNAQERADYIAEGCPDPEANFPENVFQDDLARYGLDAEQWNNIMRVISKFEQDDASCDGWTTKYTYCADIGDDRGFTLGIYGATTGGSGDVEPDAPDLFTNVAIIGNQAPFDAAAGLIYLDIDTSVAVVAINSDGNEFINVLEPDEFCDIIGNLSGTQLDVYQRAQWLTFAEVFINPVFEVLTDLGDIGTPALFGAFIDTALNEGEDGFETVLNRMDCSQSNCVTPLGYAAEYSLARKINVDSPIFQFNQPRNGCLRTSTWYNFSNRAPTFDGATANAVFYDSVIPVQLWGPYENPPVIGTSCEYETPGE